MPRLSVQRLFEARRERLGLAWDAGMAGKDREFSGEILAKPGVGLIGHLNLIHPLLAEVMGRREAEYVVSLDAAAQEQTAQRIFGPDTVCVLLCEGLAVPPVLAHAARRAGTPLLTSSEASQHVINVLRPYMQRELGEVTTLHGVFLDVLEIGVLITGDSSIGNTDRAPESTPRGHGLAATAVVGRHHAGPEPL